MLRGLIVGGFLSLLAVFGITTAVGIPAGAATPGCTHGAFAGHCGTQTDQKNHAGEPGRVPPDRAGRPAARRLPNSDTDKALDFVALQPGTSTVSGTELMLRWCNGSAWQTFTAKQAGDTSSYEWVKAATGDRDGTVESRTFLPTEFGNSACSHAE